jgi:hypothetical protein
LALGVEKLLRGVGVGEGFGISHLQAPGWEHSNE